LVEHSLGKGEVTGSIPVISSRFAVGVLLGRVEAQPVEELISISSRFVVGVLFGRAEA
jgi:hypothetical protein